jgi:hypothetical protein
MGRLITQLPITNYQLLALGEYVKDVLSDFTYLYIIHSNFTKICNHSFRLG